MNPAHFFMQLSSGTFKLMGGWFASIKQYARAHKVLTTLAVLVLVGGGWWMYSKATATSTQTRYVLGTVASGTVVASLSESGQVSASQQLNLTAQTSGQIVYIGVTPGQQVKAGTLIAEVDPTDAQKTVRDAQANLASAQLSLQKIQEPATTLTLTQAQHALVNAQTNLSTDYANTQNDLSSAFLDLPNVVTGLQDVITGTQTNKSAQWNADYYKNAINQYDTRAGSFRDDAYTSFITAQTAYNAALNDFKSTTLSDHVQAEKLLLEAYNTTQTISDAVKKANALVQLYEDTLKAQNQTPNAIADTQLTVLNGYTTKVNSHLSTLLADKNTLITDKQNILEKQQSLDQLQSGADPLDVQSSQLNLTKAQNSLRDAEETLAKCFIRAPFDGTIAAVPVNKYDQANGTIATLITNKQYADLSINEVDAAKIAVGNKATLTFDAIPNLTLTGAVAQINPVGTVTQGVVSYSMRIALDAQNPQVKSGMTANAKIITQTALDTLVVPSSAVKTQNGVTYVQVFSPPLTDTGGTTGIASTIAPTRVEVQIGISDDTNVQILSGVNEGEQIVTRTISGTATANTTTTGNRSAIGGGGIRL